MSDETTITTPATDTAEPVKVKGRPGRKPGSVSDSDKQAMAEGRRKAAEAKGELKELVNAEGITDPVQWGTVPFDTVQAIYAAITASLKSREADRKADIAAKIAALESLG